MTGSMLSRIQILPTVIVLLSILAACDEGVITATQPDRPANVPEDSMWIGGFDGGVFVVLKAAKDTARHDLSGAVYEQYSGDTLYEGNFVLDPENSKPIDLGQSGIFTGWDGERLLMADGRSLRAINISE